MKDEVAVCLNDTGLKFIEMKSGYFSYHITLSDEVYYRSLSILSIVELENDEIAVLPEYKPFIGIIDRK